MATSCQYSDYNVFVVCLFVVQIRCDDHLSTVICSDCLDEVFHFQSHYKKVQLTQLQFAKYQLMASNTTVSVNDNLYH